MHNSSLKRKDLTQKIVYSSAWMKCLPALLLFSLLAQNVHAQCTGPSIICPSDVTIECGESTDPSSTGSPLVSNGCGDVTTTFADVETAGSCTNEKIITRTWTSIDEEGNISQCNQRITVVDTQAPVPVSVPASMELECASDMPPAENLMVRDNCEGTFEVEPDIFRIEGRCVNDFTEVRVWRWSDQCNNRDSAFQVLRVSDREAPVPESVPSSMELSCAEDVPPAENLTVTDNCEGTFEVEPDIFRIEGACVNDFTEVRVWRWSDQCNNRDSAFQVLRVSDREAPVPESVPSSMELSCAEDVPPAENLTVTDNCEGTFEVEPDIFRIEGTCVNDFTEVRVWRWSDQCNNRDSAFQVLRVSDREAPVPESVPSSMELSCAEDVPPAENLTVTDNCEGTFEVEPDIFRIEGACVNDFTEVRVWRWSDQCNNRDSAFQVLRVRDDEAPTLICPPNAEVFCNGGPDFTDPSITGFAVATDNCGASVEYTDSEITLCSEGYYEFERTWTASDACGNTATSCVQTIRILTRLEGDCWSVELKDIVVSDGNTSFIWEVCSLGTACPDLSSIFFSLPCGVDVLSPLSGRGKGKGGLYDDFIVESPSGNYNEGRDECNGDYGIRFEAIRDASFSGCEIFTYTIPGDWSGYLTNAEVKGGRVTDSFMHIGDNCFCGDGEFTPLSTFSGINMELGEFPNTMTEFENTGLQVYPNPAMGEVTFRFTLPQDGQVNLEVYNLAGHRVLPPVELYAEAGVEYRHLIEIGELPAGTYFYRLISEETRLNGKLIVLE